jgi:phosphate-selective porin OprO/OprP
MEPRGKVLAAIGSLAAWIMAYVLIVAAQPLPAAAAEPSREDLIKRIERLEGLLLDNQKRMQAYDKELGELRGQLGQQSRRLGEQEAKTDQKIDAALKSQDHAAVVKDIIKGVSLSEASQTPEEKKLETIYDDGFYLKGPDDQLRIGGWLQFDSRWYLNDKHPSSDTFLMRRARLDIRGVLENDFAYRLYGTLLGQQNGILQEGWLEYRKYPGARLRLGQVFEPFSLEAIYSARWTWFMERAMIVNAISPQEDIGGMLFGKLWDGRLEYGLGVFNGQGRNAAAVVSDKDFTGRVVLTPWAGEAKGHALRGLSLGGSFGAGNNEKSLSGADFQTQGMTTWYDFGANVRQDGELTRWGLEAQYLLGPFSAQGEFLSARFADIRNGSATAGLDVDGYYLNLGWVLTGEDAPGDGTIRPRRDFDPGAGGWGAWQAAVRYQQMNTDRQLLDLGWAEGSDRAQSATLGLNWHPNRHIRVQFNYDHAWFAQEIMRGGVRLDQEDVLTTRVLFDF